LTKSGNDRERNTNHASSEVGFAPTPDITGCESRYFDDCT